jgi:hypothetical protein
MKWFAIDLCRVNSKELGNNVLTLPQLLCAVIAQASSITLKELLTSEERQTTNE